MTKFLLCFVLFSNTCFAQHIFKGTVTGRDNQPVEGAYVHALNTNTTATTDAGGKFELLLGAPSYEISVTALGYADFHGMISSDQEEITIALVEAAVQLDDAVVTAEKEETELQKLPYSISSISSRKVADYRIWNSKDIAAIVPNLYSSNPGDNRNVTSIRGVTTSSYDPAVATYVDGVNQFSLDTYISQLFDIERIEVLRGPQGTLYGRNAMGGVINIITKQPTNRKNIYVEANTGSYGQQRNVVAFRAPLIKNKLFFGASGMIERTNGFYQNDFNGSNFDKKSGVTGNYYLTYVVNPSWSITANVKHLSNRNYGAFPLVMGKDAAFADPYHLNQNATTKLFDNVLNTSLKINHSGEAVTFTSLTTYQSNYRYYKDPIDGDFSPMDIITIKNNYGKDWNHVKVFTQEFRLSSPASTSSPLRWTTGVYFFHQNNPVKQATMFGKNGDLYGGQPFSSLISTSTGTSTGFAGYGQATYTVGKVDFTGGIRFDYEKKKLSALAEYQQGADPSFVIHPDTSATISYNAISPKASVAYHVSEKVQVYGTYTRGFRTGGITQLSLDPSQGSLYHYKPEYSNNFEAGAKTSFLDNKLYVNVAAFYIRISDAQVPTLVLPQAITVTRNAGQLTSKGVELELSAVPLKGLTIDYNGGITHATYDRLRLPVTQDDQSVVVQNKDGNRQIFTPQGTSSLAVQYSVAVTSSENVKLFIRGEWMAFGSQYFDLLNTIKQSSYNILNARTGVVVNGYEIAFWIRNIKDKRYISYAYDFGGIHLGDPRTFGFTFRKSFSF